MLDDNFSTARSYAARPGAQKYDDQMYGNDTTTHNWYSEALVRHTQVSKMLVTLDIRSGSSTTANLSANQRNSADGVSRIILPAAAKQVSKKKKRFAAKTRTGCVSCKARRVKCDEGKPRCKRCEKRAGDCVYDAPKARIFELGTSESSSVSWSVSGGSPTSEGGGQTAIKLPSASGDRSRIMLLAPNYGDAEETAALKFFVKRTGPMLSVVSCSKEFWSVFVPQASWNYPAVRHMLVALSGLDRHLSDPIETTLNVSGDFLKVLRAYDRAVVELTKPNQSATSILLASVLAWMFEGVSGRFEVANMHIEAATKIAASMRESGPGALSMDETILVNTIEKSNIGDSQSFLDFWAQDDDRSPLTPFGTLDEARGSLSRIVESLDVIQPPADVVQGAMKDLRRWRQAFEEYRYIGREPLGIKRQVYLHHNVVINAVAMRIWGGLTGPRFKLLLTNVESLVDNEDVTEIRPALMMLMRTAMDNGEEVEGAEEYRQHARRLLQRIEQTS